MSTQDSAGLSGFYPSSGSLGGGGRTIGSSIG